MQLVELLPREHIIAPLQGTTLRVALAELFGRLKSRGAIHESEAFDRILNSPRTRDIVAASPDVALPHYRTNAVDKLQIALGVSPYGLDARDLGLDIRPRIVALVLAPTDAATLYLQTVSALARVLREPSTIERLAIASSVDEVLEIADLATIRIQPRLTVRDIMMSNVERVTAGTSVRDAADLMIRNRLRALPVVGDKGEVVGIVTEWDIMRGLLPQIPRAGEEGATADPDALRVKHVMTRSVLCISEDLGLDEAASMMINKDVEQFPVTSEGKLSGFLTRGDIIRKLFGR